MVLMMILLGKQRELVSCDNSDVVYFASNYCMVKVNADSETRIRKEKKDKKIRNRKKK